jgi:hypothetical protein
MPPSWSLLPNYVRIFYSPLLSNWEVAGQQIKQGLVIQCQGNYNTQNIKQRPNLKK